MVKKGVRNGIKGVRNGIKGVRNCQIHHRSLHNNKKLCLANFNDLHNFDIPHTLISFLLLGEQ